jgi:hypothetical protein
MTTREDSPGSGPVWKWAAAALFVGGIALWFAWPHLFAPPKANCEVLDGLVREAEALGKQEKPDWMKVKLAWEAVTNEFAKVGAECDRGLGKRAESNLALVTERLNGDAPNILNMMEEREAKKEPPKEDPYRKLEKDQLLKYYKVGKTIRSTATFRVAGRGSATNWGIHQDKFFQHVYEVMTETTIEKNDGDSVQVLIVFPQVTKTVVFSEEQLELEPPSLPLVEASWPIAEKYWPPLVVVRKVVDLAALVDPKGRQVLRVLGPVLKPVAEGVELNVKGMNLEVFEAPEAISGCSIRVVWERDFGIKTIQIEGDTKISRGMLYRVGDSITLFADCFVFPDTGKKEGDEWTLDARNIPGAVLDAQLQGSVDLKLKTLTKSAASLEVRPGGKVGIAFRDQKRKAGGNLEVKKGHIEFDLGDKLMTKHARIDFDVSGELASQDHFIFPMNVKKAYSVQSTYEAILVRAGAAAMNAVPNKK